MGAILVCGSRDKDRDGGDLREQGGHGRDAAALASPRNKPLRVKVVPLYCKRTLIAAAESRCIRAMLKSRDSKLLT